jgi:hypothetical protein
MHNFIMVRQLRCLPLHPSLVLSLEGILRLIKGLRRQKDLGQQDYLSYERPTLPFHYTRNCSGKRRVTMRHVTIPLDVTRDTSLKVSQGYVTLPAPTELSDMAFAACCPIN